MPSTRNPITVVQPGPGRLPAGTVPASSLTFDISTGALAAVDVHIADTIGAHEASAISTLDITGETWSLPPADVQTALDEVFEGLNARGFWVLDANPGNSADFVLCDGDPLADIKRAARKENHRLVVKRGHVAKDRRADFAQQPQRVAAE